MDTPVLTDQQGLRYISSGWTLDAVSRGPTKSDGREKDSGNSVHDDDDDDDDKVRVNFSKVSFNKNVSLFD